MADPAGGRWTRRQDRGLAEGALGLCHLTTGQLRLLLSAGGSECGGGRDELLDRLAGQMLASLPSEWRVRRSEGEAPRREYAAIASRGNSVYMVGGGYAPLSPDAEVLWQYDMGEGVWSEVHAPGAPCIRSGHSAVVYDEKLWLYGGYSDTLVEYFNDMTVYDFEKQTWETVKQGGISLEPRAWHSVVVHRDNMLLYGDNGDCEQSKENSGTVYSFSFKTKEWSEIRTSGDCPPPDDVVELAERGGKLYVLCINYGGSCNLMAIYCLNLEGKSRKWSKVRTSGTPPCGRIGCSATVLGDCWYVHGGFPRTQRHPACWDIVGDTYEYNFKSQGWSKVCPVRDGLLPRGGHVAIAWRDAVVFMGGTTSSGRTEQVAYLGGGAYCTTVEVLWKCPLHPKATNGEYVFTDTIRGIRGLHRCDDTSDVLLISGDTSIKAHRAILSAASKTFHRMFSGNFSEMRENKSGEVHLDSIAPSVLETMIAYVYGVLKEVPPQQALDLFRVGDLYCIDGLKEEALSQLRSTMSVASVATLARVADEHSCEGLFNAAVEFASDPAHLLQVFSGENYLSMLRETPELGQKFTHMCTCLAFGAAEPSETPNGPACLDDACGK